ncbi:unnamed protein product [Brugia pahangi]|uniref:SWIM-type domain-containing protein n=1 Tax=Brugia pahangi TaxID=6280 RepID=A0A0N4TS90_BRUPA|nr:unnamed protein product [Brugia pahangi]
MEYGGGRSFVDRVMPGGNRNLRSTLRRRSVTVALEEPSEDVDVGGGIGDSGVHELVDVEGDAPPNFPQETAPTTKIDEDEDENQPVMKIRRITTPAYAIRRIDRRVWPSEVPRKNYNYGKTTAYSVRKEQELAPNPNNPHFCFTGHQRLYPYRFYLDLIRRAKRDPSIISLDMPKLRPVGGTIIVYDCHGIDQNRALHNDGYRWGRSKGVKLIQSVGNRLVRTYHFLYDPNNPAGDPSFKKYRFSLKGENYGVMVMHYIGDEKHAAEVSARCMRNNDPMAMLAYSEAQQGVEDLHSLNLLPLPMLNEHSSEEERNKFRQTLLSNIQGLQRQLLYENEETFVERVEFDDCGVSVVYLFCYPLVEQLIAVAGYLQQGTPFRTVQLFYHTEPVTVDYHLSTLSFVHPFFEGDQVLPIAFMISSTASPDRCDDHDSFLSTLYDRFNELLNGRFVIITGQSLCFTPDAFPVAEHIRCWDDFKRVKLSYIETLFGGANLNEYASDMNILMSCTYEKLFDEMWGKISACKRYTERPDVYSYFDNVWSDFKFTSSIWHLKNCGVPDADKGITWRPCKGLSKLVSQLCDSNALLDTIIISLFLLSNAYRRLFIAGLHQSGAWRLKKCYRERFQQSHLKLPKLPYAPAMENIVMTSFSMCPNRPYKRLSHDGVNDGSTLSTCLDNEYQNHPSSLSNQIDLPSTRQAGLIIVNGSVISLFWEGHPESNFEFIIDADDSRLPYSRNAYVRLVSPMTFAVRARDGSPHIVEATHRDDLDSLQWYCSCGLRQRCSHIASVMLVLQSLY